MNTKKEFNLTHDQCVAILRHENETYKINQEFKRLPQHVQDNAREVLREFANETTQTNPIQALRNQGITINTNDHKELLQTTLEEMTVRTGEGKPPEGYVLTGGRGSAKFLLTSLMRRVGEV